MNEIIDQLLHNSPLLIVFLPIIGAILNPIFCKIHNKIRNVFIVIIMIITTFLALLLANNVFSDGIQSYSYVGLIFEIDAMSSLMLIISSLISLIIIIYFLGFVKNDENIGKYYSLILLVIAGILGLEITGDMFNFFLFLILISISGCALISFSIDKKESYKTSFQYVIINVVASFFLLFSIAILYTQYETTSIAELANNIVSELSIIDKISLVFLVISLSMIAGIAPLHMWLVNTFSKASSPVNAILFSVSLAAIYGITRVCFTIFGNIIDISTFPIGWILIILGLISIIVGVVMIVMQVDLKKIIGFAAISEIGFIILGIGSALAIMSNEEIIISGSIALKGSLFHIINSSFNICLLFFISGGIILVTRETEIHKMGGLAQNMKYSTIFFIIGILGFVGMPPMNSYTSKLLIYESTYQLNPILSVIAIISSICLLALFTKILYSIFFGRQKTKFKNIKKVPISILIAMIITSGIIICFSLFPGIILENIVEPAMNSLLEINNYIAGGI